MSFQSIQFFGFNKESDISTLDYGRFSAGDRSGTNQRISWSNDGITWTNATTPNSFNYFSIDFSEELGLYVAVADATSTSNIISSTNSVTWTQRSKPNTGSLQNVKWCNQFNKWLACSPTTIYESSDGITWTVGYTFSTPATHATYTYNTLYDVTPSGAVWATVLGSNAFNVRTALKLCYTTDGTNFNEVTIDSNSIWDIADGKSIKYSPELNLFTIVNQYNNPDKILISNSIDSGWTYYTQTPAPSGATPLNHEYGQGKFVIPYFSGASSNQAVKYSTTGLTGSWVTPTLPSVTSLYSIEYAPEISTWVITRSNTTSCYTSPDALIWTQRTTSSTEMISIVWAAGVRTNGYKQGADVDI